MSESELPVKPPRLTDADKFHKGRKPDAIKFLMLDGWVIGVRRLLDEMKDSATKGERVQEILEWMNKWVLHVDEPTKLDQQQPSQAGMPALNPYGNNFAIVFNPPAPPERREGWLKVNQRNRTVFQSFR